MDYKRIAAVAALTAAIATPAIAQAHTIGASQQHRLHDYRMYRRAQEQAYPGYRYGYPAYHYAYRYGYGPAYGYEPGFWPGDVAAGIVGGAIGTAGAIVAAPFGTGPYAYYDGPYAYY